MNDMALLISVIGIPFLVVLSWALGLARARPPVSETDFEAACRDIAPQTRVLAHAVFEKGRSGLARLSDGRLLVLRRMGADLSVRTVPTGGIGIRRAGDGFSVGFHDAGFPPIRVQGTPPEWLAEAAR